MTALSQPLAALVHAWQAEPAATVPEHLRDEAQRKLRALAERTTPASAEQWRAFLAPLSAAVRNPQTPEAVRAFAAICAAALAHVPAALLTREAQTELVRQHAFWPAVAELDAHFREEAGRLHRERAALCRIASAPPALAAPERPTMTDQQREAASAQLAQLAAELRARSVEARSKPRASSMKPRDLAAIYRADAERLEEAGRHDQAATFRERADAIEGAHA